MFGSAAPWIFYFGVVLFWSIIFVIAVTMTRRSLHGVGEPMASEAEDTGSASSNGHSQGTPAQSSGSAKTSGARG